MICKIVFDASLAMCKLRVPVFADGSTTLQLLDTRFVCRLYTLNCLTFACGSDVLTSKQNTGSICHYLSRILLSMFWRVALRFFKKWPSPASLCNAVRFLTTPQPIGVGTRWALEVGIFSGAWGSGDLGTCSWDVKMWFTQVFFLT